MQLPICSVLAWLSMVVAVGLTQRSASSGANDGLPPPMMLERQALTAGNPLATYAAIRDKEAEYLKSPFAKIYPEIRYNFEEFLGFPQAGVEAMDLPTFRTRYGDSKATVPDTFRPENAITVIEREAKKTRIVIFGEEHHLPQTRSLYESMLRVLWKQGYRYLAAETF